MNIKSIFKRIRITLMDNKSYINYLRRSGVEIGDNCVIHKDAHVGTEPYLIKIGNNVRITTGVMFITHDGGAWVPRNMGKISKDMALYGEIKIGNNVNIGWNTIIMPGVTIGDNCIIGCGAIVTKSVPSNSVAVGIPAHVIENIDDYVEKNLPFFLPTNLLSENGKRQYITNHGIRNRIK